MKVLVVGSGGREHALAWKLKQSPKVTELYSAPGNAGTAEVGENIPARTSEEILGWLSTNPIDLVVIGPDEYLAEGLADRVEAMHIPVFGPSRDAAEIEWSKSFAKQLMREEGIPTARCAVFDTVDEALIYVRSQSFPCVIKADGLAAGKGVVIAQTRADAEQAVTSMMTDGQYGDSGQRVVIEEYLDGFELSVHAFSDGSTSVLFPSSKDHKRIYDGDRGPNTGGMGTIAPVPQVTESDMALIQERIVAPTLKALAKRGRPFRGLLYPGVMLTKEGPKVIEFNARFGDPETQSYMRILESDVFDILLACATGSLHDAAVKWSTQTACCVVLASAGYPGTYEKGIPITLPTTIPEDIVFFHAGTVRTDGTLITNGGRVLNVTATGTTLSSARAAAYAAIPPDIFPGVQYRRDIGAARERE